ALTLVGAADFIDLPTGRLLRAWAQRDALAGALICNPDVLLLDNPLMSADSVHTRWWRGFVEALSKGHPFFDGRPLTLVVTCENPRPWRDLGKQFAILHDGKCEVLGGPDRLSPENHE